MSTLPANPSYLTSRTSALMINETLSRVQTELGTHNSVFGKHQRLQFYFLIQHCVLPFIINPPQRNCTVFWYLVLLLVLVIITVLKYVSSSQQRVKYTKRILHLDCSWIFFGGGIVCIGLQPCSHLALKSILFLFDQKWAVQKDSWLSKQLKFSKSVLEERHLQSSCL